MKSRDILAVFNRGRISRLAVARTDVARVALSSEVQTNWMPRTLGSMSLRPGMKYNGAFLDDGAMIPFVYSNDDVAMIELTATNMRVWENGDSVITRPSVSSVISNGGFGSNLNDWTDADDGASVSDWTGGFMRLLGASEAYARRRQEVTVSVGDQGTIHAVRVIVKRGPVVLKVGTTAGGDDVFRQAVLRSGIHSIAFVPGGNFHIEFSANLDYPILVDSCILETAGDMSIMTPWVDADECKAVRWSQSADVVFLSSDHQQMQIERRPNDSWSLVFYESDDGPYLSENTGTISLSSSGLTGSVTISASEPVFEAGNVGGLFKISSQGQEVQGALSADLSYTDPIRVSGVTSTRIFQVVRAGTWSGTLTLQRSVGTVGNWEEANTYNSNGTSSFNDGLDNSIVFYRIGFSTGDYVSGTADVSLVFEAGSITGVVRVSAYTNSTTVTADVLVPLGGTQSSDIWAEGAWSEKNGWPSSVSIWEGRLWWAGLGRMYGSVSDIFYSFDPEFEGDAGPINRRVGEGAVNNVNWLLPLSRLIAGTDTAENSVRSNSIDEPVTPSNYNTKAGSTKGGARAPAIIADDIGYFIGRTGRKVYELNYNQAKYSFSAKDMTLLVPEIGDSGFVRLAIQMVPDMRVFGVRSDGTCGVLVRDEAEDVLCWVDVETLGDIQDVIVLPGSDYDRVIFRIKRTINSHVVYYNEEMASEDDCVGGLSNLQLDSFATGTGTITVAGNLPHLEGESVAIWADGVDQGLFVLGSEFSEPSFGEWVAGIPYVARYKSAKLAGQTKLGLSITQTTRINSLGLVLADTHYQGLRYGPSFDAMDDLPLVVDGAMTDADTIWESYDKDMVEFPGEWSTDNRLCLEATAPRPCTVLGAVMNVDRQDHD